MLPRFLLLLLLPAAMWAATNSPVPRAVGRLETGQPVRLVCFGDSVTGVYYHTGNRRAWCDLLGLALQRRYPAARIELINAGISSQTTADALARLETDVLSRRPDLVVLMFGLNDVARLKPEAYRANLQDCAQRIRAGGAELVFMTPNAVSVGDELRPPEHVTAYASIMREVGRDLGIPVADACQAFQAVQASHPDEWQRMMSDTIHPNLRGHILLAEVAATAVAGEPVKVGALPALSPRLPHVLDRLRAGEPLEVVAMKPYDELIGPALRQIFPSADVRVTTWDPTGKTLAALEIAAEQTGWRKFHDHPNALRPDLMILAVPAEAAAASDEEFFRRYSWILNWSQDFRKPARWDCLAILPSLARPNPSAAQRVAEAKALDALAAKDLPMLQRPPDDRTSLPKLFADQLRELLAPATP